MKLLRRILILSTCFGVGLWAVAQDTKPSTKESPAKEAPKAAEKAAPADPYQEYLKELAKARAEVEKLSTHKTLKEITVKSKDGKQTLQTMTVSGDGTVYALVAPPKPFGASVKDATSEVHVLDKEGKETGVWTLKMHATAINISPDGTVFVAGDGKVARFKDGKQVGEPTELAMIAEALKDTKGLREKAEKQVKAQKDSFKEQVKRFKDQLAKIEEKKEEDRSKTEVAQLKNLKQILESYKETEKYYESMTADSVLEQMLARVRVVNGLSVSEKDLFVVCGETEGYGYAIWRMGLDMKGPKKVLSNVMGCCLQMDIQCCGEDLLVAENTKHRFARYDRDGKELSAGGKRGKDTEPGCFGGCCNPMNVRAYGSDVYTAESEGIVRKFSNKGEFLNVIGTVNIQGGCKNVAVGATKDGKYVYFCDQPGSKVFILQQKETK